MNGSAFDLTDRDTWAPSTTRSFRVSEKAFGPPVIAAVRSTVTSSTVKRALGAQLISWSSGPGFTQTGAAEAGAENGPTASVGSSTATSVRNQRVARERMWLTTCSLLPIADAE